MENGFSSLINTTDSNYLDRCFEIYDAGSGIDTQEITVCNYDNAKRVISIIHSDLRFPSFVYLQTFRYYYAGNDSIPYKTSFLSTEEGGDYDSITTFHFYDNQHRKIKDSALESKLGGLGSYYYTYKAIEQFSYAPGKMYHQNQREQIIPFSSNSTSRDTATLDIRGNIINNKKYFYNGITYELSTVSDFTYDNHFNPFAKLSFFKSHSGLPNGETLFFEYLSYNNRITQNEIFLGINSTNVYYNYTYNTAGYPKVCNSLFNGGSQKTIYTYKTL
ncbi:MAG: hypothetical protein WKF88_06450 [Ferruginibacter sp.]